MASATLPTFECTLSIDPGGFPTSERADEGLVDDLAWATTSLAYSVTRDSSPPRVRLALRASKTT